jgi:hypothetical protein
MSKFIYFIFSLLFLSACSVGSAYNDSNPPDLSKISEGTSKTQINSILGHQKKISQIATGEHVYIYEYKAGHKRSIAKTLGNLTMDLATLGAWELVEPQKSDMAYLYVTYDEYNKASSINDYIQ